MSLPKIYLLVYGVLLLTGAYFGQKAGSKISMIMGLASGILTLFLVYLHNLNPAKAKIFLLILSAALSILFLCRFVITKKFMPSGMLMGASALALWSSFLLKND